MLTCEEIAVQALSRTADFTSATKTRSLMYRRVGVRQHQLFSVAGNHNPEYFGASAWSNLDANKAADLRDFIAPVPTPEQVQQVTIHTVAGGSPYVVGREIAIVSVSDAGAELPPRMTLRDAVLRQVGTDLATVTAVRVWYSRQPVALGATSETTATELPTPWDELLVLDLARYLLRSAKDSEARTKALQELADEETEMLAGFIAHVTNYSATRERFARPPQGIKSPEPK